MVYVCLEEVPVYEDEQLQGSLDYYFCITYPIT